MEQRGQSRWRFGGTLKRTISFYIDGKPHTWLKGTFVEIPTNNKSAHGHLCIFRVGKVDHTFHFKTWLDVQDLVEIDPDGGMGQEKPPEGKVSFL